MYHEYYQLTQNPFNVTADPDFFFSSKIHRDAISNLEYGIESRKGILVITGEIGTGKTTLCRTILRQAGGHVKFALVLNPNFSELQLLQFIIKDLGIESKENNKFELITALNEFLIAQTEIGNNVVIIIDEAQNLSVNQLEQIRLLSNLETEKEKLLQIILVGQPELNHTLALKKLRQLKQRVAIHFHLRPLEMDDIRSYIEHRLNQAVEEQNAMRHVVFTQSAIDAIYQHTQGSPRSINILCDRALLAGFVSETRSIDENIISNCAKELPKL
jgi:general secretion pathway protein A